MALLKYFRFIGCFAYLLVCYHFQFVCSDASLVVIRVMIFLSQNAFRKSLNRPSGDQILPAEDSNDLERTVLAAVHEADERLCALTNGVRDRIRGIEEATDQYRQFTNELIRLRSGLDRIEVTYQKCSSDSNRLGESQSHLSTDHLRKIQMQLDSMFASIGELNTLGCALQVSYQPKISQVVL